MCKAEKGDGGRHAHPVASYMAAIALQGKVLRYAAARHVAIPGVFSELMPRGPRKQKTVH